MRTRNSAVCFVVVVAALGGCYADTVLPDGTLIGCASDDDCPPDWDCVVELEECRPTSREREPPALSGDAVLTPPAGTEGTAFTLTFTVDEALLADPVVVVDVGGRSAPFVIDDDASDGDAYVFRYVADGSEEAGPRAVTIDLVDASGNVAAGLGGGSFVLDFKAPALVGAPVIGPAVVTGGDRVDLDVVLSEPVGDDLFAALVLVDDDGNDVDGAVVDFVVDENVDLAVAFHADVPAGAAAGRYVARVHAVDVAGIAAVLDAGAVVVDTAAPVVSAVAVAPAFIGPGGFAAASFVVDEEVGALPVFSMTPVGGGAAIPWGAARVVGVRVVADFPGEGGAGVLADGVYDVSAVGLSDVAGNVAADVAVGTLTVDSDAPSLELAFPAPGLFKAGQRVPVVFDVDEDVDQVQVLVGDTDHPCTAAVDDARHFDCAYVITGLEPEGGLLIRASARDGAGNVGFAQRLVELDFTPPAVAGTPTLSPTVASRGVDTGLVFGTSEAVVAPVVTVADAAGINVVTMTLDVASSTSQSFVFGLSAASTTALPDGSYSITLDPLVDVAGNVFAAPPQLGTLTIDGGGPAIANLATNAARFSDQPGHDQVAVTFDVDEDPALLDLQVTFGATALTCSNVGPAFLCPHSVVAADAAGTVSVVVRATDRAGNTSVLSTTVEVDRAAPALAGTPTVSPQNAARAGDIAVAFSASEAVVAPTVSMALEGGGPDVAFVLDADSSTASSFVFRLAISSDPAVLPDGRYVVSAAPFVDDAGNASAGAVVLGAVVVDGSAPVTRSLETDAERYSEALGHSRIVVTFTTSEASDVRVSIGGALVGCTAVVDGNDAAFTCAKDVDGSVADGPANVVVSASDLAGNTSVVSKTVEIDRRAPELAGAAQLSTRQAARGDVLTVSFSTTEPVGAPVVTMAPVAGGAGVPLDFDASASTAQSFVFRFTVPTDPAQLADGDYAFTVSGLRDVVDNDGAVSGLGVVTVDGTAPVINALSRNAARFSAQPAHDDVLVTFDVPDDATGAVVDVDLDDVALDCSVVVGAGGRAFACDHRVVVGDGEGVHVVVVQARDGAGNSVVASVNVTFDFTGPSVAVGTESRTVVPGTANPLANPVDVAVGSTIRYAFGTDEAAAACSIRTAPDVLPFSTANGPGASFVFNHILAAGRTNGLYTANVTCTDDVDNAAVSRLSGFTVDSVAPAAPRTDIAGRVLYTRIPNGTKATAGVRTFTVVGGAGAVTADVGLVRVVDDANLGAAAEVGRTGTGGGGTFNALLARADRAVVFVVAVDAAGNQSAASAVRDVEWVATLGGKVPFSSFENPHVLTASAHLFDRVAGDPREVCAFPVCGYSDPLDDNAQLEVTALGGLANLTASTPVTTTGSGFWTDRTARRVPPLRDESGLAVAQLADDRTRGRVVQFINGQTWEWDGSDWKERIVGGAPPPTTSLANLMTYDPIQQRSLLIDDGTWAWDGDAWQQLVPNATTPPAIAGGTGPVLFAFQPARRKSLLVFVPPSVAGVQQAPKTFEFDGVTTWTEIVPTTVPVPPRSAYGAAHDPVRNRTVLFGGFSSGVGLQAETWEFDGVGWVRRCDGVPAADVCPGPQPPARIGPSMAFDEKVGGIVLHGGQQSFNDTWVWDGVNWRQVTTPNSPPVGTNFSPMVYDSTRRELLLPGVATFFNFTDTFKFDGANWFKLTTASPGALCDASLAFDATANAALLFGGEPARSNACPSSAGGAVQSQTWRYDGAGWTQLFPIDFPPPRRSSAMVEWRDATTPRPYLFGGENADGSARSDTFRWEGTNWRAIDPFAAPGQLSRATWAYDAPRNRLILGTGCLGACNNTLSTQAFSHNGAFLVPGFAIEPEPPAGFARQSAASAEDVARGNRVLFGGNTSVGFTSPSAETWIGSGTAWTLQNGLVGPPARQKHVMAFDGRQVVLFGGDANNLTNPLGDTWLWSGTAWKQLSPTAFAPPPRSGQAATFDRVRKRVVMLGGAPHGEETWEWASGDASRPGQSLDVVFAAAGADPADVVERVDARWTAGGTGGSTLLVWDAGRWRTVARNAAPVGTPANLNFTTSDPAQLGRLFLGAGKSLRFAVASDAANGNGVVDAAVVSSDVEVHVKYRRP